VSIFNKFAVCFVFSFIIYTNTAHAWSTGPKAYRTGAPVDNEKTCKARSCHNSFPLNSGNAKFSITTNLPVYTPGKTIKVRVSFQNWTGKLHGFEMTAVDANGSRVGTFKKVSRKDNTTQVIPPNAVDPNKRGLKTEDEGKYIEHTLAGNKKTSWTVKWQAPSTATGLITFYAAGNDANGNGVSSGDHIYTTQLQINATSTATIQ
jgi:Reeler domain-containing protein